MPAFPFILPDYIETIYCCWYCGTSNICSKCHIFHNISLISSSEATLTWIYVVVKKGQETPTSFSRFRQNKSRSLVVLDSRNATVEMTSAKSNSSRTSRVPWVGCMICVKAIRNCQNRQQYWWHVIVKHWLHTWCFYNGIYYYMLHSNINPKSS